MTHKRILVISDMHIPYHHKDSIKFLKEIKKEFKPDYVVPEIEALSIEALKELEDEGFNIVPNARTVEITMNRDKIRDLASKDLKIKTAKFDYIFEFENLHKFNKSISV